MVDSIGKALEIKGLEIGAGQASSSVDNSLVREFIAGNDAAFTQLVTKYKDPITNYLNGMVGDYNVAVDLAQETFLRVYRNIGRYSHFYQFSTWIYRIAVTRSLDAVRARNRAKRVGQVKRLLGLDEIMNEMKAAEDMAPDLQLEEKERREILLHAIEALAENQRVATTLAKLEGFSYAEVADIMQTSISSIESLLSFSPVRGLEDWGQIEWQAEPRFLCPVVLISKETEKGIPHGSRSENDSPGRRGNPLIINLQWERNLQKMFDAS